MKNYNPAIKSLIAFITLFATSFGLASLFASPAQASPNGIENPWIWDSPNVPVDVAIDMNDDLPFTSDEQDGICDGGYDYYSNTDVNIGTICLTQSDDSDHWVGDIVHERGDWGITWSAVSHPFNANSTGWRACRQFAGDIIPGNCNKTDRKTNFGYVIWNINAFFNDDEEWGYSAAQQISRHEMGHIFGMDHHSCNEDTVMKTACSGGPETELTSHDLNHLNNELY